MTMPSTSDAPHFDGTTYDPHLDHVRLTGQCARVYSIIRDGRWRTLSELADLSRAPEASVSARLRDLRKKRFGAHVIGRRRRGPPGAGIFEYRWEGRHGDYEPL